MLRCVISGGPCSGKSSSLARIEKVLTEHGYKVFIVPETATELMVNGIKSSKHISKLEFQEIVLEKQLHKEKIYDKAASYYPSDKVVIIYDRGIMDGMAYIEKKDYLKLLKKYNLTIESARNRYDAVIHLVTVAKGDVGAYTLENNVARLETTPEEAIKADERTMKAWIGHPHLRVIDNSTNFDDKINRVLNEIFSLLGEDEPVEIERKFLINKPTKETLDSLEFCSKTNIIQTYLKKIKDNTERRVRQRGNDEGYNFYYTEKTHIEPGKRVEVEKKITANEYVNLLAEADISHHQISKTRYCFIYKDQYFELDIYPFSKEKAILEIELKDINQTIELPPYIDIVKEVTDDIDYTNYKISEQLTL